MRQKAKAHAQTPVTSLTPRTSERGQRLANKIGQNQSLDGQLRASYNTPTVRTPLRGATPVRTPLTTTTRTKRSASDITPRPSAQKTKKQKVASAESASLTDGLL